MANTNCFENDAEKSNLTNVDAPNIKNNNVLPGIIFIVELSTTGSADRMKMISANDKAKVAFEQTTEEMDELGHDFFVNIMHADDIETIFKSVDKFNCNEDNQEIPFFIKLKPNGEKNMWIVGNYNVGKFAENGVPLQLQFNCVLLDDDMHIESKADQWCKERRMARHKDLIKLATSAEIDVWKLYLLGNNIPKIMATLKRSDRTIRNQTQSLYDKFNVHNRVELIALGFRFGLN